MALQRDREEEIENQLNRGALWAVTYGDLMSYLMVFFLLLFILTAGQKGRAAESLAAMQRQFGGAQTGPLIERMALRSRDEAVAEDLKQRFTERGIDRFAKIAVTEQKIQITLSEPLLFDSGLADLKPEAGPILQEFADAMRALPHRILIEGHTDDVPVVGGRFGSNWELSMARAYSVLRRLIDRGGIDPKRLTGGGYGEQLPVAPNATAAGRAANRRVEISVLRPE